MWISEDHRRFRAALAILLLLASALLLNAAIAADSASDTFSVSLTLMDDVPPSITVNSLQNSSISADYRLFNISLSELGNCTLHLNGTDYVNSTNATEITWYVTGMAEGNYSSIYYTCEDAYNNTGNSSIYWLRVDTIVPTLSWNWADINSTIQVNYTTVGVDASETVNCTLHLNGTDYINSTSGTSITWALANLVSGNYSSVSATCDDSAENDANTTTVWLNVNYTALNVIITKSVDASVVEPGDVLNWTITVNNTGPSAVNVTLNDSNGRNFTMTLLAPGTSNTTSYTTNAACSSITNVVNATIVGPYSNGTAQSSASLLVSHCGDKICNCGETWSSCRRDCKKPKKDEEAGALSVYQWPGYPDGPIVIPPEAVIELIVESKDPSVGRVLAIILMDSSGAVVKGELIITRPDGTSFKERLEDGGATITPDQPGFWTFSYVDINGRTLAKRVFVKPKRIGEEGGGPDTLGGPGRKVGEEPGIGGLEIWIIAILGIVFILILLVKTGKVKEPPRQISNILRAAKYNITKK